MDSRIISFIEGQKTMTLCTAAGGLPYCASCYYSFLKDDGLLVFKSSRDTRHIREALSVGAIAGTILPEEKLAGQIKGIQFTGRFVVPDEGAMGKAGISYYARFPFALAIKGELFIAQLDKVKMTDNTLGFGRKLNWERQPKQKEDEL